MDKEIEIPKKKLLASETKLIFAIYVVIAIGAAANVFRYGNSMVYLTSAIVVSILSTIWAIEDAKRRKQQFYGVLRMLHVLLFPFSLFIYLVYTRGLWGVGLAVLHFVGQFILANLAFYGMFYLIYVTGWWSLYDPVFLDQ